MAKAFDDDDVFGEFAFAADPKPQLDEENDDEWSDFVRSPQQQSTAEWIKPSGALPLSIFGEEDRNGDMYANSGVSSITPVDSYDNHSNSNRHVSFENGQFQNNRSGNNEYDFSWNGILGKASPVAEVPSKDLEMNGERRQVEIDIDNGGWNFDRGNLYVMNQNVEKLSKNVVAEGELSQNGYGDGHHDGNDDDADEDDGWEFKAAYTDSPGKEVILDDGNLKVDMMAHQDFTWNGPYSGHKAAGLTNGSVDTDTSFDFFANTSNFSSSASKQVDIVATQPSTAVVNGMNRSTDADKSFDFFANTGGTASSTSKQVDFVSTEPITAAINGPDRSVDTDKPFDFFANTGDTSSSTSKQVISVATQPNAAVINDFVLDASKDIASNHNEHVWDRDADTSADDDFGDFTSASADDDVKPEVTQMVSELSPSNGALSTPADQILGKDTKSNRNGPLQLSIFGLDEPETGSMPDLQDAFGMKFDSDPRNSHTSTKAVYISDLVSSLYSQSDQTLNKTQSSLSSRVSDSNSANGSAEYIDNVSWEHKDAVQTRFDILAPESNENSSISAKLKLNNYLDFYLHLTRVLTSIAEFQVKSLEGSDAVTSYEGVGFADLDNELQLICKELEHVNIKFQESSPSVHSSGDSFASDLAEVLKEPQFQLLESEYPLLQKLFVVDKDLKSVMELLRHANTMTRILTFATIEEQMTYITTWDKMISICADELKHGALIWNQAVKNHIQNLLLSERQGTEFILALGEIYRVVVVLEASVKLFKLWIISASTKLPDISSVIRECHSLWSASGLEEALSTISTSTPLDSALLLKSIKQIKNHDALALQKLVFAENSSFCQLSCLSAAVVPDMKLIPWGKDWYFVTLANLWANRMSHDPPNLPALNHR